MTTSTPQMPGWSRSSCGATVRRSGVRAARSSGRDLALDAAVRAGVRKMVDDAVLRSEQQRPSARKVTAAVGAGVTEVDQDAGREPLPGTDNVLGRFPIGVPVDIHPIRQAAVG